MELKESLVQHYKNLKSDILSDLRKDAITNFEVVGFPTVKHEEWKYTNLKQSLTKAYAIQPTSNITKSDIQSIVEKGPKGFTLVFVNGFYQPSFSTIDSSAVEIKYFQEEPALTQKYFGKNLPFSDSMISLNLAFATQGTVIRVKKGKVAEQAIICYFISDARQQDILVQPSILTIVEEAAHATIAEIYHTLGSNTSFTNIFSHTVVKQDGYLETYKIQNDNDASVQVNNSQLVHEAKCVTNTTTITIGGGLIRNSLSIALNAEYNEAHLNGLYLTNGSMHVDNHTLVDHAMPNCYSNELYKGVLNGKSTGVFNGKIWVRKDAQKTNAFQSNKNVLISKEASVNTKPQLEIFADDVKCSHGATTGQLDENALYYMRARGIGEENAKKLLVHAFAFDVIDKIQNENIREYLVQEIEAKL
jgi:Fe-S cluster assembly protein SufD